MAYQLMRRKMPVLDQQLQIAKDRKLGFNEYGPHNGCPLFYFHGSPSARVEFDLFGNEALLQKLDSRLIAIDRPGYGLSDFQPNRRFMDWPQDVLAVADHLHLNCFAILGYSGGGPYAAVCALAIPQRITKVGIVSGTAPFVEPHLADGIHTNSRNFMDLSHHRPWLSRLILRMMGLITRLSPDKVIANALASLPEADQMILSSPEVQQAFLTMIQEALRNGPRGSQHDTRLMVTEWNFRPEDIQVPVHLWHGEIDQNAPVAMGRYMANAIPRSQAKFYPSEGHLSLFKKNIEEILYTLSK
jgi:pimeloyl-ACP methyl ester carboxylesterase